ncbi:hypothetical protein PUNSTDRAFT_100352 [Punctularia strigosozonata HHB-11173 SS5]|uniref:uncharacterized protein n=1 Tax=Punctularia strigosozonata (strain HHB-11173) TaxID=741275 RepID=UPI0004417AFA|nr:uncharacterized protein PUNSTDRAFT_100352 [Punctularia strigosozonata HHB-11173 SS5]EIN10664.1 hypothetical protein PUNSTDRAFT_100352 [Punctularia strigosozonata HHB-11173 SS5]
MDSPLGDISQARSSRPPRLETAEFSTRPLTISPTSTRPPLDATPTLYAPPRTSTSASRPTHAQVFVPETAPACPRYTRPRGLRIMNLVKPFVPIILYGMTSIGFLIAIAFWKSQVFHGLDDLSHWIREEAPLGYVTLFSMIVITTIPPVPLYSTLIILSGYTFGAIRGAVLSYSAALTGAVLVFLTSRYFFRESITKWLTQAATIKRVVRAIEKRPTLLFLIRLAPYPYNVMNCLLAASPTLTFKTYTVCTALSLFKVIIHTTIGASIHSFADYHLQKGAKDGDDAEDTKDEGSHSLKQGFTIGGIILCVSILVYLSYVARKAVDEELDDDDVVLPSHNSEERVAFLASDEDRSMSESPLIGSVQLQSAAASDASPTGSRWAEDGATAAAEGANNDSANGHGRS